MEFITIFSNAPGLNKSEKREFRARQRARHIGGQEDAFEDWDQEQLQDGLSGVRLCSEGGGSSGKRKGFAGDNHGGW